jgi:uncharacterized protein (DUF697 family)
MKIANPFFKASKSLGKGLKVAAMSALAVGGLAAGNHFLGELAPVLVLAIPGPGGVLAAALLTGFGAGALEALRNALAHRKITPEELQQLLEQEYAKGMADDSAIVVVEKALNKHLPDA